LLEPIYEHLDKFHQLIIVPHGVLHYLPFHALFDGNSYLVERFPISYLPGSSFLGHYLNTKTAGQGILSLGHSYQGQLPNAVLEADKIARLFNTEPLLEEDALLGCLQDLVSGKQVLHFACHGEFYPNNPLFSGLSLEDGWLTTLDVFNLRIPASLVTLSACETGRIVVGGGDELLGIMRAFLTAGAASLVLSHWAVEDRSTLILIENFYQNLLSGKSKAEALQNAQVNLLTNREMPASAEEYESFVYSHPYYWAPFFLIGDYRKL
jgi:CHAT domain-containing protein